MSSSSTFRFTPRVCQKPKDSKFILAPVLTGTGVSRLRILSLRAFILAE